jgi:ribonuclease P protein component
LVRTSDYRKVYAEGRRRNLGVLLAFVRANGEQLSRVGMTVPRAFGGAVERNRVKRRLREAVRKQQAKLAAGWDIVLHPRAEAKTAQFRDLEAAIERLFVDLASGERPLPGAVSRAVTDS